MHFYLDDPTTLRGQLSEFSMLACFIKTAVNLDCRRKPLVFYFAMNEWDLNRLKIIARASPISFGHLGATSATRQSCQYRIYLSWSTGYRVKWTYPALVTESDLVVIVLGKLGFGYSRDDTREFCVCSPCELLWYHIAAAVWLVPDLLDVLTLYVGHKRN